MKKIAGVLAVAAVLLVSGAALAHDGWMGPGPGHHGGASAAAVRKFQKETLSLRDDLAAKQVDLAEEYDKESPDQARIASIRKDIADLEAGIQAAADKYGVRRWGSGRGMMGMRDGHCGCGHCW